MSSTGWPSERRSTTTRMPCRTISMNGWRSTTSSELIRGDGALARRQCRHSSTPPRWRAKSKHRQWPHNKGSRQLRSGGHPPRQIERPSDQIETSTPLIASLIRAERTHRQARSISYRISGAKFPVLKDLDKFVFADTTIDQGQVRELATGAFLDAKRNAIFIGGTEPAS